jgi:hypothetical protein
MTIVNNTVNDIAATVLPDAPIDPATGLPVPTIAVATDGGVSVIKDDGTVVDYATTNASFEAITVGFTDKNDVFGSEWFSATVDEKAYIFPLLSSDGSMSGNAVEQFVWSTSGDDMFWGGVASGTNSRVSYGNTNVFGDEVVAGQRYSVEQLVRKKQYQNLLNYTTSTYNTGWMNGDIKGAFLSDTDDTDLVGATPLDDDFSSYADQAAAEAAGWGAGTGWSFDAANDKWDFDASVAGAGTVVAVDRDLAVVAGKTYIATAVVSGITNVTGNELFIKADDNELVNADGESVVSAGDGTYRVSFVASSATINVQIRSSGVTDGDETASLESFSVKLADADRSVNNNGLIVNGTVTRSPVATGADLVAYSGFTTSNYLSQPYNADLDFGTGDFCISFWSKLTAASGNAQAVFSTTKYAGGGLDASGIYIRFAATTGYLGVAVSDDDFATLDLVQVSTANFNSWDFYTAVRSGSNLSIYRNGALAASGTITNAIGSLTSSEPLTIGTLTGTFAELTNGSLALLRISATAPTAEQIKRIYEDEKVLFQENAQATLYGSSDAVTALAHDPVTDLLHVGTSAGRSVFQGLRRVSNTTTAVGTAISAQAGLVVEE